MPEITPVRDFRLPELREPWWEDIVVKWRCTTRILMVADGGLDFGTGGFGLSEAVSIVAGAGTLFHPVSITTAHRGGGTADIQSFRFDAPGALSYDEVWMFGIMGRTAGLDASELQALGQFMDGGGGVFATGDHDELGAGMCGQVPRVRSMRNWFTSGVPADRIAPPGGGEERIDTNVPNPVTGNDFDNQSDAHPQRVYPTWYEDGSIFRSLPHPLLAGPGRAVTHLPDHPHEGKCVVPSSLDPTEFPGGVAPEIVAWAVSAGAAFDHGSAKVAVRPQLFGVVGAYDGHRAGPGHTGVGRVVVDSTWHHWLNINLNGTGSGLLADGTAPSGLYDGGGNPTPEYEEIRAYFRNIARWLRRRTVVRCWFIGHLVVERLRWPLVEEIPPLPDPQFDQLVAVGEAVAARLEDVSGPPAVTEAVLELASMVGDDSSLGALFDAFSDRNGNDRPDGLLDRRPVAMALLGGAMTRLGQVVPTDPAAAAAAIAELVGDAEGERAVLALAEVAAAGARDGLRHAAEELDRSLDAAQHLGETLRRAA